MSLVLKQAQLASDPRSPIKSTLLVQAKDLIDLRANNLDIVAQVQSAVAPPAANGSAHSASNNANSETFRTDTDISSSSGQVRERTLQTWGAQMGGDAIGGIEDDLSGMTLEDSTSKGEKWDQFAANERLYGMKSDFDEEMYTTKLDRSAADYKARAQKAAQLEREILQASLPEHLSRTWLTMHLRTGSGIGQTCQQCPHCRRAWIGHWRGRPRRRRQVRLPIKDSSHVFGF